ncbi:DUF4412 domain-containing protein [Planktosalinus lacus]|uniref:DUF4412 domain-containing protein n=1 Tax=Planktosalinus lacus TaxID=1526573 RepID=UPI0016663DC7|nr:DUF4412 domain-containing protein [Planktosalinus lacus]
MKTHYVLLSIVCAFFLSADLNAQFLKKLSKKVENKVENTVINKTSDKAGKETGKAVDKVLEPETDNKKAKNERKASKKSSSKNMPSSYEFEYQYQMTMTTSQGKMNLDYFLKPGASYLGLKMNQGVDMFMVMDGDSNTNYMFMNSGGTKIATATSLNGNDIINSANDENDYTITDLPPKKILGYNCLGKQMENDEYLIKMYYTTEADVSFNDVFKSSNDQIPDAMKAHFNSDEGALMMYMDMVDKKNKGKRNASSTMECTLLKSTDFTFKTSGYQVM